jgi:nitrogen regulatory protein PII
VIVNCGQGSKVLSISRRYGMPGGTLLLGRGTIKNRILEFFELADMRKEIVLMVSELSQAKRVMKQLGDKLRFRMKRHGIAFIIPVGSVYGASKCQKNKNVVKAGEIMYQSIIAIVERGRAETVIDAATQAGARGGTIINARGSGIHETSTLFAMEIEPEKEVVLIVVQKENTENVVKAIREHAHIDEPGRGIIFVQDVLEAYGLS